ncbi:MAG: EAL domain-containing protein [Novosphingobium sp.]
MSALQDRSDGRASWLLRTRAEVPPAIALQLMNGLFASVPIFLGGIANTTTVAALAAWRHGSPGFIGWLVFEIVLGVLRLGVLLHGRRRIAAGRTPPRLLAAVLSCTWAASVGFGTFLCLTCGDWVLATIACLSAAAMVCGICLRNFGTPRLAAAMVFLALAPCAAAGLLVAEPALAIISVQLPVFMATIFSASFALHRMLVSWMTALSDLERSTSLNHTILRSSPDYTLILDEHYEVMFFNRPGGAGSESESVRPVGRRWLSLLPKDYRRPAELALDRARTGTPANLAINYTDRAGRKYWFDIAVSQTSDGSGRFIVVARDITHQKQSEEKTIWMAQHDALTGLPNRAVLQERLDATLAEADASRMAAMLILDVDNFKLINDTLGHDGGDALLCAVADRLRAAVATGDLVARTGGDEFALIVTVQAEDELERIAQRIFDQLREPIHHGGRLFQCGASIGASFIPRDGKARSEIMKAADIALYAAKAAGRAQLKVFEPAMMVAVERHQTMIASARHALRRDTVVPYYQPKVSFGTLGIVGFEALLRWRDHNGGLRGPDALEAAFEDPALGAPLSERMLDKVLDDVQSWVRAGVPFGHVAVNVTGADFRRRDFAESILARLAARSLPASCLQIEVTENVFLGRGTDAVKEALRHLSDHGIRIALDDFGTGYASLSHLNQFPVDLLKIDRSFVEHLGTSMDAEAIASAVINLGHCLGLEVIAEGVETAAQEAFLTTMGCDTGQGFLYAPALPAGDVPAALDRQAIAAERVLRA